MGLRAQAKAMSRTHGPSEMKGLNTVGRRILIRTLLLIRHVIFEFEKCTENDDNVKWLAEICAQKIFEATGQ